MRVWRYLNYLVREKWWGALYPTYVFVRSRCTGTTVVHVVGDSHTQAFFRRYPFIVHHLGAATAYNLASARSTTNSGKQLFQIASSLNHNREMLLLVFGEIDCRIHIYKRYRELNGAKTILSLIKATVRKYGKAMEKLAGQHIPFAVLSASPAGRQKNIYGYPYYATFAKRAEIVKRFNKELAAYCREHGYRYADLYREVVNANGGIKRAYRQDEVHLNANVVPIVKKLLRL